MTPLPGSSGVGRVMSRPGKGVPEITPRACLLAALALCLLACGTSDGTRPAGPDPAPPAPPAPLAGPLSGSWVGLTSESMGLVLTQQNPHDALCTNYHDWRSTL